jgi:hypothetical protein
MYGVRSIVENSIIHVFKSPGKVRQRLTAGIIAGRVLLEVAARQ